MKPIAKYLEEAIQKAEDKGVRVTHYSLESNHIHLIIEAADNASLTSSMRTLLISFAMKVKFYKKLTEPVIKDRYHLHVLKTPQEARNAVNYVVYNHQKHCPQEGIKLNEYAGKLNDPKSWLLKSISS